MNWSARRVSRKRAWLHQFFRPVRPEEIPAEERFEYNQFLQRARQFAILKGCINAALLLLYMFTLFADTPITVLITLIDGLVLILYVLLVRRWPALSTTILLTTTALAISAAEVVSGYQTATSGVLYAALIVGGAILLFDSRGIAVVTACITSVYLLTFLLETPEVFGPSAIIPVQMSLLTHRAVIRVTTMHTFAFLALGAASGILTNLYQQFLQTRSQSGFLSALLEGFQDISVDMDLSTLLQRIAERAVATIPDAERALLMLQENVEMVILGAAGFGPLPMVGKRIPLEEVSPYLETLPSRITDLPERLSEALLPPQAEQPRKSPPSQVTLFFPIHVRGDMHILMAVTNPHSADAFDAEAQQALDLFAHQAAVAIDNAHLYAESNQRLQEALALHGIGQEITSLLRMNDLVPAIYRHITQAMEAPSFIIGVQDPTSGGITLHSPIDAGRIFPDMTVPPEGALGWVIRQQRPLRCGEFEKDLLDYPDIKLQPFGEMSIPRSVLVVPLQVEKRVIGVLSVQSLQAQAYSEHDERLLSSLASYVAVAVQNARLYAELQQKAQELQQKQAELQGLIAAVSQRLQGPVEALAGFARLLRETAKDRFPENELDYLKRIERNSRSISQLIRDMIFLSRLDQVGEENEPIALSTLVRGVSTHLELERQGIALSIPDDLPTIYADPVLMWTFFSNVLENACRLLWGRPSPRIDVECAIVADGYRLCVRGNGETIPKESLDRAFELFFPFGNAEGAGIGLAVAQRIGQRYGGRMWVESEAGQGTSFCILLPREQGPNPEETL